MTLGDILKKIKIVDELRGIHVTSDPEPVYSVLKNKTDIAGGRAVGKVGDLRSSGLYFSEYPQMWMNRAYKKWDALANLSDDQRMLVHKKLKDDIYKQFHTHYITETEKDYALRSADNYLNTGDIEHATTLAGQPYNIPFWKQEYLSPLGIKQTAPPLQIPVTAKGKFADLTDAGVSDEIINHLKSDGYHGAFVKPSFSTIPQSVVWDTNAIKQFGEKTFPIAVGLTTLGALQPQQAQSENWRNFKNQEPALQEPILDPTTLLAGPARWGGGLMNLVANTGLNAIMGKLR